MALTLDQEMKNESSICEYKSKGMKQRKHQHNKHHFLLRIPRTILLIITILLLSSSPTTTNKYTVSALEATFTPEPDKDTGTTGGPLPLSQNQRNQLLQLDQHISSSSNPAETLQKVAQGNGMAPEELQDLLLRNRRDMQMAQGGDAAAGGGGGMAGYGANTIPRQLFRLISTCFLLILNTAKTRPQTFSMFALAFLSIIYIFIAAPRNGIVISTSNGWFSSGHTTWLHPPTKYLSKYVQSDKFNMLDSSVPLPRSLPSSKSKRKGSSHTSSSSTGIGYLSELYETHESLQDIRESLSSGVVQTIPIPKELKKDVQFIVHCKTKVPFEVLLPSEEQLQDLIQERIEEQEQQAQQQRSTESVDSSMIEQEVEMNEWNNALSLSMSSSETILSSRRFTEFVPSSSSMQSGNDMIKFYSSPSARSISTSRRRHSRLYEIDSDKEEANDEKYVGKEGAALIVKKLGDWGRFGIQPLRVAKDDYDPTNGKTWIVYHTLKGGHFDGEISITVEKQQDNDDGDSETSVVITAALLIPRRGRKLPKKLATSIISSLTESIVISSITEAKKIQSRKMLSSAYRGRARSKAAEKRHLQFDNMKKMEEMAAERRRRWQRRNPGSGGYRPSSVGSRLQGGPSRGF